MSVGKEFRGDLSGSGSWSLMVLSSSEGLFGAGESIPGWLTFIAGLFMLAVGKKFQLLTMRTSHKAP